MATNEKRVGPYQILERIGAGGMGEVFLARDTRLERNVALKMLPPELARDSAPMALFRGEALALAAINHPNIATIFGFEDSEEGALALVLERVEGITLAERLRDGALPLDEALRVCAQIADALEAAHARGVIHRDLKPANVMIDPRGRVKVLDFGLAHRRGHRAADETAPGGGDVTAEAPAAPRDIGPSNDTISGTPSYMSPEQILGTPEDERADVFAFGCLFYECVTGRRAFTGQNPRDVWDAVLRVEPDWTAFPASTPKNVRDLIRQCLEKTPERRLASIQAARAEIEDVRGVRRAAQRDERATKAIPHHLPFQTTSFVGREQAVEECLALFRTTRLLTITGAGGGGKTRLAMRLTELLAGDFRDGAWFVDLAPVIDESRVPDVLAAALGLAEEIGLTASETLARHLAGRRVLIVLDNCEHLLIGCAKLARTLLAAAPDLKILATSRELLGVQGETAFSVPTLSLPDPGRYHDVDAVRACESVQLFIDRALLVRQDFVLDAETATTVAEICRRLDGIPLAIELAAARVRVLSVKQILDRMHDRFRLLAGGRGAVPRHQTLRASIQWSYDQLTDEEQRLLRRVAIFSGGWTLEAATACGEGWDEFEVLDLLARLVDKSLVIVERQDREDTRYRCLETVRQFGEEQLTETGEWQTARNQHRDWVLAFAERAAENKSGSGQNDYHNRLEREIDNLRAALAWCRDDPRGAEAALRLAAAVDWFWSIRGHYREGREWLAEILGRGPFPASPTLAGVLKGAGNLAWRQDDYEEARRYYERCLEVRRELGDELGIAAALGSLGNVSQTLGELETARSLFEQSLDICRRHGHKIWLGTGLTCLGNVSRFLRDFETSQASLEEAIAVTEETGDMVTGAIAIGALGDLLVDLNRFDEAIPYFERALALQKEMGDLHSLGFSQLSLGSALSRKGEFARARALFQEALPALVGLGARLAVAGGLEDLARLLLLEKNAVKAVHLLGAASAEREAIASPPSPGRRVELGEMATEARIALGEAAYAIEWDRGRAMTLDRAIADVFGKGRQTGGDGPSKTTLPSQSPKES